MKKPLDVRDFGAKGDGVTDDTAALQAAVDAAGARPLTEFEIHSNTELVGDLWESFLVIVHNRCGALLGESDGYDMLDLETAEILALNHTCEPA